MDWDAVRRHLEEHHVCLLPRNQRGQNRDLDRGCWRCNVPACSAVPGFDRLEQLGVHARAEHAGLLLGIILVYGPPTARDVRRTL